MSKYPPSKIETVVTVDALRKLIESDFVTFPVDDMNFRIEPIEGGSQRDPELIGIRAVWWTPKVLS